MTGALVATDLDGTLVYSRRSAGPAVPSALRVVEQRDGVPAGWTTRVASDLLEDLAASATWVPATARTVAQFRRLTLPRTRWAVCALGGVLLVDGCPDAAWRARTGRLLAGVASADEVAAGVTALTARLRPGTAGPLRRADGLFLTAIVDGEHVPDGWDADLAAHCAARGWRAHRQPRKLHVVPDGLDKVAAVEEIRRRVDGDGWLAAGDSALDVALLTAADAGVRPAHGELHALGRRDDHVAVTRSSGIRAGEEIVEWLLDRLSRAGARRGRARGRPRAVPDGSG